MQGADLVAGGIQQIGQIEVAYGAAIALAGCVTVYGFGDGKDAGRGVMPVS